MPVHFKGTSEYDTNYKWFDSYKSRSFSPQPEQLMDPAGTPSVNIYTSAEPPLQHKKRLDGPATSLSANYFVGSNNSASEYTLLGQQDKFANNVKYQPRQASPDKKVYKNKENFEDAPPPSKQLKMQKRSRPVERESRPQVRSSAPQESIQSDAPSTPLAPREAKEGLRDKDLKDVLGDAPVVSKSVDTSTGLQLAKAGSKPSKAVSKSVDASAGPKGSSGPVAKPQTSMNAFVQTNLKKGVAASAPEAPSNYALQYKAGVAPNRPLWKSSEYQKQFQWKKGLKASPLIAAQEIIHKSNTELGPYKTDAVPKQSEYNRQFQAWNPQAFNTDISLYHKEKVKSDNKQETVEKVPDKMRVKRSKSVGASLQHVEQADEQQDVNKELKAKLSEQHGKIKRQSTEYRSNYKSPTRYSCEKGAWRGASAPQMLPPASERDNQLNQNNNNNNNNNIDQDQEEPTPLNNWFAEVLELRRRASEYRQRAQGTHFSRQHLVQLMAGQAQCWDTPGNGDIQPVSDNIRALDLHTRPAAGKQSPLARDLVADGCSHQATQGDFSDEEEPLSWQEDSNQNGDVVAEAPVKKADEKKGRKKKTSPSKGADRQSRKMAWLEKDKAAIASQAKILDEENQRQQDAFNGEDDNDEVIEGRLPTPVLKQVSPSGTRRHHLDLTTPSIGGAILSAPASKESKLIITSRSGESYVTASDDFPNQTQQKKTYNLEKLVTAPLLGRPSGDSHPLRDDDFESDQPLKTHYIASPAPPLPLSLADEDKENAGEKPAKRKGKKSSKASKSGQLSAVQEDFGKTWNYPGLDEVRQKRMEQVEEDAMSVSMMSVASSASLASEVLERTLKRKDFWAQGRGGGKAKD